LSELRKRHKQTLDLCSVLIKDRELQVQGRIICETTGPLRQDHLDSIQLLKSQQGALQYHASQANMGWVAALQSILRKHSDPQVLQRICVAPVHASALQPQQDWESDPDQYKHALLPMRLTIEVLAQRCWSMAKHSHTFPDAFAGLASSDHALAIAKLAEIREVWTAILAAEQACKNNPAQRRRLEDVLKDIAYHAWQVNREFVAELQQAGWDLHDESITYMLWSCFARPSNTKQFNEDVFNHLRHVESTWQKNRKVNRWTKYWEAVHAPSLKNPKESHVKMMRVLEQDWQCPLPWSNAVDQTNEGIFMAAGHMPKPPIKVTDVVGKQSMKLKPAGPQANFRSVAATVILRSDLANDWQNIDKAWCGAPHT
jgi:hypothetical protein